MIKDILFIIAISAVSTHSDAQTFNQTRTLNWNPHTPAAAVNVPVNVSSVSVISHLPDSTFIGVAPGTVPNERTNIEVPGGINIILQALINREYGHLFKENGIKAGLIINEITCGNDSTAGTNTGFIRLNADICARMPAGSYRYLGSFDTLIVRHNSEVNFEENILQVLNGACLKLFVLTGDPQLPSPDTSATPSTPASETANDKIFTDSVYQAGLFTSFDQFKKDSPAIKRFSIHIGSDSLHSLSFYFQNTDGSSSLIQNVWGISAGNELYIFQEGQLYPIEKYSGGFYLSKYINPLKRKNQAIYWRRRIGALQGDNNPFDDAHIYRAPAIPSSGLKLETTYLDMKSGQLTF